MKSLLTRFSFKRAFTEVRGLVAKTNLILSQKYYISKVTSYHSQDA
ncbi:hypothetical protein HDC90_002728 [Pedobacter sp. AK013]|nr:hypothetical protein [Pedobacter sp. AK013]